MRFHSLFGLRLCLLQKSASQCLQYRRLAIQVSGIFSSPLQLPVSSVSKQLFSMASTGHTAVGPRTAYTHGWWCRVEECSVLNILLLQAHIEIISTSTNIKLFSSRNNESFMLFFLKMSSSRCQTCVFLAIDGASNPTHSPTQPGLPTHSNLTVAWLPGAAKPSQDVIRCSRKRDRLTSHQQHGIRQDVKTTRLGPLVFIDIKSCSSQCLCSSFFMSLSIIIFPASKKQHKPKSLHHSHLWPGAQLISQTDPLCATLSPLVPLIWFTASCSQWEGLAPISQREIRGPRSVRLWKEDVLKRDPLGFLPT